ncbi:UDP-N-acetylgalactosamine-undecaprenyl-phosphate N-acetylgalactosaminephosphotransferase [compost metagenome]
MYKRFIKRSIDIFFALIGLPILLLILIFVAPLIVLTDKGPIFYNAKRIGKDGKLFKMYKFRSMLVNAPDIRLPDGSTYNGEDDTRVTKIGKFMRKTSFDEVPQIVNVLKGDMSLIGPRPDPPDWIDRYSDEVRVFLTVKPGITGYSQAFFRNSVDGEEKMKNDTYYALNYSFILDVKIFLRTLVVVFKRENTYKDTISKMDIL